MDPQAHKPRLRASCRTLPGLLDRYLRWVGSSPCHRKALDRHPYMHLPMITGRPSQYREIGCRLTTNCGRVVGRFSHRTKAAGRSSRDNPNPLSWSSNVTTGSAVTISELRYAKPGWQRSPASDPSGRVGFSGENVDTVALLASQCS